MRSNEARPRRSRGSASRPRRGFTLIEVLAAAIIMAMFYGVLSAKGVEGFVLEGDADRRLRASLVADRWLADLETEVAQGAAPPTGTREVDSDGYRVRIEVEPFVLPMEALLPERPGNPRRPADARSLLSPEASRGPPPLRSLAVTVSWNDGLAEHAVHRNTFLLDGETVAATLEQAGLTGLEPEVAP